MTQRILLMSSSRKDQLGYLEHAGEQIHVLLKHESRKVLFVPFAAVTFSFDSYEDRSSRRLTVLAIRSNRFITATTRLRR